MRNNFDLRTPLFLALTLLLSLSVRAEAKTPWSWLMSLKPETAANSMRLPTGVYVDESRDRYYVMDSGNNRLLSFDLKGQLVHSFTADNELQLPFDMTRTETGNLWVVEKGRNSLTLIDLQNKQTVPHTLTDQGRLIFPSRISYSNGKFLVLDKASGDILLLDQDLMVRQRFICPSEGGNGGLVDFVPHENEIWALDQQAKTVYRFQQDGAVAGRIKLGNTVHFPISLAIGPSGYLYILDRLDGTIAAFDGDGQFKYSFLELGQSQGQLYYPAEIRFDPWGHLCVVDEGNGRVEVFSR